MPTGPFTTCLWFDGQAEAAAKYYTGIFPDAKLGKTVPGPDGSALTVEFELNGQQFVGLNGGPEFTFNESISFQIHCKDQEEVDFYWDRLTADGGQPGPCGWLKDRYGVSWQVIPDGLVEMISDPDPAKAGRATEAMMSMGKLDLAALRKAHAGE